MTLPDEKENVKPARSKKPASHQSDNWKKTHSHTAEPGKATTKKGVARKVGPKTEKAKKDGGKDSANKDNADSEEEKGDGGDEKEKGGRKGSVVKKAKGWSNPFIAR